MADINKIIFTNIRVIPETIKLFLTKILSYVFVSIIIKIQSDHY